MAVAVNVLFPTALFSAAGVSCSPPLPAPCPPLVPFWILSSFLTQQLLRSNRRWGRSHSPTPGSEAQSAGVQCGASQLRGCEGSRRNERQTGADVLTETRTLTSPGPPQPISLLKEYCAWWGRRSDSSAVRPQRKFQPPWGVHSAVPRLLQKPSWMPRALSLGQSWKHAGSLL